MCLYRREREPLSIDPGLATGWALWDKGCLRSAGLGLPFFEGAAQVVIEKPQVYPNQPVPPNDLITLAIQVGRYWQMAVHAGAFDVQLVLPHQWKGNLPKNVCASRILSRLSDEEKKVVENMQVQDSKRHNVLDAIGLGLFVWRGGRM